MSDERFLVTGALGCVGSWTVKQLLEEGAEVWTYDLPSQPHRLKLLLRDEDIARLHRVDGDITDFDSFDRAVASGGITHIIHLAALQVPFVRADPVLGARVNVVGTTIVLEAARRHADHLRGLVYASSVAVYGGVDLYPPGPLAHEAPLSPPNLYGVFKQTNEGTARVYWEENRLPSIGLRPYVVYGPGRDQGWTSTPTKAMLSAVVGRPYHIGFGGTITYHHAAEVAATFVRAARTGVEGAPVFNIGGAAASMDEVVAAIEQAVPESTGTITFDDVSLPHPGEIDDSALQKTVGRISWLPITDGVRRTIEEFRAAISAGRIDVESGIA